MNLGPGERIGVLLGDARRRELSGSERVRDRQERLTTASCASDDRFTATWTRELAAPWVASARAGTKRDGHHQRLSADTRRARQALTLPPATAIEYDESHRLARKRCAYDTGARP
jgi:hypothetical protein